MNYEYHIKLFQLQYYYDYVYISYESCQYGTFSSNYFRLTGRRTYTPVCLSDFYVNPRQYFLISVCLRIPSRGTRDECVFLFQLLYRILWIQNDLDHILNKQFQQRSFIYMHIAVTSLTYMYSHQNKQMMFFIGRNKFIEFILSPFTGCD